MAKTPKELVMEAARIVQLYQQKFQALAVRSDALVRVAVRTAEADRMNAVRMAIHGMVG